jgi:NhaP-type Na+/H+ or K+/H+ antiporter
MSLALSRPPWQQAAFAVVKLAIAIALGAWVVGLPLRAVLEAEVVLCLVGFPAGWLAAWLLSALRQVASEKHYSDHTPSEAPPADL